MAKVDWITWKTNKDEIINPNYILERLDDAANENSFFINKIKDIITSEIYRGGLDSSSLNIMGTSPANEKATNIVNNISDIENYLEKIKDNVYKSTLEQKKIEKEELIEAIQAKLLEEEKILNNKLAIRAKLDSINTLLSQRELDGIIESSNDRINKLKERLDMAKSL